MTRTTALPARSARMRCTWTTNPAWSTPSSTGPPRRSRSRRRRGRSGAAVPVMPARPHRRPPAGNSPAGDHPPGERPCGQHKLTHHWAQMTGCQGPVESLVGHSIDWLYSLALKSAREMSCCSGSSTRPGGEGAAKAPFWPSRSLLGVLRPEARCQCACLRSPAQVRVVFPRPLRKGAGRVNTVMEQHVEESSSPERDLDRTRDRLRGLASAQGLYLLDEVLRRSGYSCVDCQRRLA
jgi:hypothetical protein